MHVIGYGTFLFRSMRQHFALIPIRTVKIYGYQRIYHNNLPHTYPFIIESKAENFFTGILFQISQKSLLQLDIYEGVPKLYRRINYPLDLPEMKVNPCYLYVPSKTILNQLEVEIKLYLSPKEQEEIFSSDLWLDYLREQEPELVKEFPDLFAT